MDHVMIRRLAGAAVAGLLLGCSTSDEPAATPTQPQRRAIAAPCTMGDGVPEPTRKAVLQQAQAVLEHLRGGDDEALWAALHPQARRPEDRAQVLETFATLRQRLEGTTPLWRVELVAVGDVEGGANDLARLVCREDPHREGPPDLTAMINVGGEDVALVGLVVGGEVFDEAVLVQLRRRGDAWRLLGLSVHPSRYRGAEAQQWAARGRALRADGKVVPAWVATAIGQALASRGAAVTTRTSRELDDALAEIAADPAFVAQTEAWTVAGRRIELHGLSLASTQRELSLVVKYRSEHALVGEQLAGETDTMMDHVRTRWPELAELVDGMVFEAYDRAPLQPGAAYDAYRSVKMF